MAMMMMRCWASGAPPLCLSLRQSPVVKVQLSTSKSTLRRDSIDQSATPSTTTRRELSLFLSSSYFTSSFLVLAPPSVSAAPEFFELPNSGGVRALDLRIGSGEVPALGDQVAIHYYGRLAAKQGWRFDSTYDHKDGFGESVPFVFILGSENAISGIQTAVRSMKVGGIRRVVIPLSQGYQSTSQEPIPPNFFDRQRLFTTIFNPTRLANGQRNLEGALDSMDSWTNACRSLCRRGSTESGKRTAFYG